MNKRSTNIAACLAVSLLTSACALNPYEKDPRPPISYETPTVQLEPHSLQSARHYAERTYHEYRRQLSAEYDRQQLLSTSLIGVGAAVLGLAAFDAGTDAIVAAALAGGTGYTIGTWNTSRPRLHIYVEGMSALVCAKRAMQPLALSETERDALTADHDRIVKRGDEVATAAGAVTHALAAALAVRGKESEVARTAQKMLEEVGPALNRANSAYVKGHSLLQASHSAGADLEDAIDKIRSDVTLAIEGTLSDLSSLPNVLAGLAPASQIFAPELDLASILSGRLTPLSKDPSSSAAIATLNSTRDPTKQEIPKNAIIEVVLSEAIGELRTAMLRLDQASGRVTAISGTVDVKQVKKLVAGEGCGVDPSKLSTGLVLSRSRIDLKPETAVIHFIRVTGGTLPYQANHVTLPATGINIDMRGDTLTIVADTQTQAGETHVVEVLDTARNRAEVTIAIEKVPETSPSDGGDGGDSEGGNSRARDLVGDDEKRLLASNVDKRKAVQAGLCTPESASAHDSRDQRDGEFGGRTRFRILQFAIENHSHTAGPAHLSEDDIALLGNAEAPAACDGHLNWFEKQHLDQSKVCKVRVRLGLSAKMENNLDTEAREKIRSISAPVDPKAAEFGQLSALLLGQIQQLPGDATQLGKCQ